jgi:singapore isolate B (sub-type 7) whole genome shotgun sequence assembly, scaffold_8
VWEENVAKGEKLVREAAAKGAQVILLQELFAGWYFCQDEKQESFALAEPASSSRLIAHFQKVAKELNVVLPISFFEKDNQAYYNSIAIIDADGTVLGVYRKSHIPDGPGYEEKFYFNPGDTGFKVWNTKYCKLGVAICWDQWFPEAARIMTLMGAEVLSRTFIAEIIYSVPHCHRFGASGHRSEQQRPLETHDAGPLRRQLHPCGGEQPCGQGAG